MENFNFYKFFCRFCLKDVKNLSEITETVEELFYDLTQTKLTIEQNYSNLICEKCIKDLIFSTNTKKNFLRTQTELESLCRFTEVNIKIEIPEKAKESNDPLTDHEEDNINECEQLEDSNDHTEYVDFLEESIKCEKCDFVSNDSEEVSKHYKDEHEKVKTEKKKSNGRQQCTLCGVMVKNVREHMRVQHAKVKRFFCDKCPYSCFFKTKITRHLMRHIPKNLRQNYPCTVENCQFVCSRKDSLKNHIQNMHQENRQKKFNCSFCEKLFFTKFQLNVHIKAVHEKIKNNQCVHCGKSFFNSKDLRIHEKRHFEKKERCSECDSFFACKTDLSRHFRNIHTPPDIVCVIENCGRRFHTNAKLKHHIKTRHELLKDFLCSYCHNTFAQYNNLKRHINAVHKSLRINCVMPDCNYSTSRKDKYKVHLITHHKFLDENARNTIMKNVKLE